MSTGVPSAADLTARAQRLLAVYFTGKTEGQRIATLALAFGTLRHDPREGLDTGGAPADFAAACTCRLMEYGCTDDHRHALSRLLQTIRGEGFGTHPPADYCDLPPLLDALCALPSRDQELAYLRALIDREEARARLYSPLRGLPQSLPKARLAPRLDPWGDDRAIALLLHRARACSGGGAAAGPEPRAQPYEDILDAFAEVPQAALLGAPGAGKSTTLRRLAVDRARRALGDPKAPLPLLVGLGYWTGDQDLASFLADQAPEIAWAVPALARRGRLILLLDGLNEVPSARRQTKAQGIKGLREALPRATPFIVSCRLDDYVGDMRLDLDSLTLEPLSPQRVRAVLRHWLGAATDLAGAAEAERLFWQLAGDPGLAGVLETWLAAGASEDEFWNLADPQEQKQAYGKTTGDQEALWRRHVPNPRSLLRLGANPFLLTMLYVTWASNGGRLPHNRGELLGGFVEALLVREGLIAEDPQTGALRRDARADLLLDDLATLAWRMQSESGAGEVGEADPGVRTVLPRAEALRLMSTAPPVSAEDLLKLAEDATLLEGAEEVRFRHQLLQEYFAAVAIRQHLVSGGLEADGLWPRNHWWGRSGWEEAAVLLAGLYSDDCTPVVHWLRDRQPEVAARCILEGGAVLADRGALLRELHDAWLPRLTDIKGEPAPEARAAIARALGLLGLDDRKGVVLIPGGVPDIDWVPIPGGGFLYQDGEWRTCAPFRIARYPVTHAQFHAFLDAPDGYLRHPRWSAGLDNPDRFDPQPARWPIPNHPRETVSWFEAIAFCAWLGDRLGLPVRLPTEWEWERAARGTGGLAYPWGNDYRAGYANIDETHGGAGPHRLGQTSAVGAYPQGASPEGVMDLAGNVWEWCLNEYEHPERIGSRGRGARVVRGGSWRFDQAYARVAYRDVFHPANRFVDLGFRVLVASPFADPWGLVSGLSAL